MILVYWKILEMGKKAENWEILPYFWTLRYRAPRKLCKSVQVIAHNVAKVHTQLLSPTCGSVGVLVSKHIPKN